MIQNMEMVLEQKKEKAIKGREFWSFIQKEYQLSLKNYVLLLPKCSEESYPYAIRYIETFLEKNKAEAVLVLATSKDWCKEAEQCIDHLVGAVWISEERAEELLTFYCLYEFTDRLIVASLDEPEGRMGSHMVGWNGITLEEVVKVTLYDLTEE